MAALVVLLGWNVVLTAEIFSKKQEEPVKKPIAESGQFTSVDYTSDISNIVDEVKSSVVLVEGNETGSGVVYGNDEGHAYILTACALVQDSEHISIVFDSGAEVEAKCIGIDEVTGLAVLRADVDFNTVIFSTGDSDLLDAGEYVVGMEAVQDDQRAGLGIAAVGKPGYGLLSKNSQYPVSIIEADMHMGEASQGGAMLNAAGQLIGIIVRGVQGAQVGYTYAMGANEAAAVYEQLMRQGYVERGWIPMIGMNIGDMRAYQKTQRGLDLDIVSGVLVNRVSDKLQGSLQRNDVILTIDGETIKDTGDLRDLWYRHKPGDVLEVGILRNQKHLTVEVIAV